jgi:hypothetical protein
MLLINLVFSFITVNAQETSEESAEIVALINTPDNRIPPIGISNWTVIDITVLDAYGINWTLLSTEFPFLSQYVWPIIHPNWQPFLGFSSLRFETEIVEGNPKGWYAKVTPSAIPTADQGKEYKLKLEVQTDDIAVDYAVVVGIKATRVNVYGVDSGVSYIYIPVKASSLNNIKMETEIKNKEAAPFSYVYFDLNIKNYGYYRDMFSLEFEAENGLIVAATKQIFVLDPEDSDNIRISVLTPEKLFDVGTPNKIEIYAKSSEDQTLTLIGTIVVITQGFYISPLAFIIAIPIIFFIILIYLIFFVLKDKKDRSNLGKPDKPWNIPEEKKYLEELKSKNKDEYYRVLDMMKDEYNSSMLWYKNYFEKKSDNSNSSIILKNFFKNQKNNLKNLSKKSQKNEEELKGKNVKTESKIKKINDSKNKYFSSIKNKFKLKKEPNESKDEEKSIDKNKKNFFERKQKKDMDQIVDDKKDDKIKKIKSINNAKEREKEKIINKIKKNQEKQRRKINK